MADNLRQRLGRLDPVDPAMPTDDTRTPRVRALLEEIMNTSIENQPPLTAAIPPPPKRRLVILAGVAAAIIAVAVGVAVINGAVINGGSGTTKSRLPLSLALSLPHSGPGQSCIQFSTDQLAQASDAFSGTVTEVTDSTVTISVDHWYKAAGAKPDQVQLTSENALPSELGVEFSSGQHYLVSATDGHVNGCGFSGPDSPELLSAFTAAFPG